MKKEPNKLLFLESKIHYVFNDKALLHSALTHSSALAEHPELTSYERLEYLGDAVLELLVTRHLYMEYPYQSEGWMTRTRAAVVSEPPLADIAEQLDIGQYLVLGKGTDKTGGRKLKSILSDAMEALIGAVYLDGGIEQAQNLIMPYIGPRIKQSIQQAVSRDYKTRLQELVQEKGSVKIKYILVHEEGPSHDKQFTSAVVVDGQALGQGTGKSKKQSQQAAAKQALETLIDE